MKTPKTAWKKGDPSPNPKGRPKKGYSITEWFKQMLDSKPEVKDAIGKSILQKALQGDQAAQRMVWQYMDGMPEQNVDFSGSIQVQPILGGLSVPGNVGNPKAIEAK